MERLVREITSISWAEKNNHKKIAFILSTRAILFVLFAFCRSFGQIDEFRLAMKEIASTVGSRSRRFLGIIGFSKDKVHSVIAIDFELITVLLIANNRDVAFHRVIGNAPQSVLKRSLRGIGSREEEEFAIGCAEIADPLAVVILKHLNLAIGFGFHILEFCTPFTNFAFRNFL